MSTTDFWPDCALALVLKITPLDGTVETELAGTISQLNCAEWSYYRSVKATEVLDTPSLVKMSCLK